MNRIISLALAAVMGAAAATPLTAGADGDDVKKASGGLVLFGDSIAAGYGLDRENEYDYGEIVADYLGCGVENYAHSGDTTTDLLAKIDSLSADEKANVAGAKYVVVSIGGNDLMHYASKQILIFAADKGLLYDGFSKKDIPEDPGISDLLVMADLDKIKAYPGKSTTAAMEALTLLKSITANLRDEVVVNDIVPNIDTAVDKIKAINPNAKVIVQTIYQPIEFDPDLMKARYGEGSDYLDLIGQLRLNFEKVMKAFRTELQTVDGIEVADVYAQFVSLPSDVKQTDANPGYSYLFTSMQEEKTSDMDFHPNQKGHLAIAATILDTIGDLHDDDGLLTKVFVNMESYDNGLGLKSRRNKISYPLIALDTYKKVAGNYIFGDVNFDGSVDGSDATKVLVDVGMRGGGFEKVLSDLQYTCGDANKDGDLDGSDATDLLRYYALVSNNYEGTFEDYMKQKLSSAQA